MHLLLRHWLIWCSLIRHLLIRHSLTDNLITYFKVYIRSKHSQWLYTKIPCSLLYIILINRSTYSTDNSTSKIEHCIYIIPKTEVKYRIRLDSSTENDDDAYEAMLVSILQFNYINTIYGSSGIFYMDREIESTDPRGQIDIFEETAEKQKMS